MTNLEKLALTMLADELHEFCAAAPHDYPGHNIELFERAEATIRHLVTTARPAPTREDDEDHPDCATGRERELFGALMLLASFVAAQMPKMYRNALQGGVLVEPIVSKALRLPVTGEEGGGK